MPNQTTQKRLEFHGGPIVAAIPLAVSIIISGYLALGQHFYGSATSVVPAMMGLIVTAFLAKDQNHYWRTVVGGLTDYGTASLIFVFMLTGVFTKLLSAGQTGQGFVWLALKLGLTGGSFAVIAFVGTAIFSLGSGIPFAALAGAAAVFYVPGVMLGVNPAIMAGTLIGGGFFGDGISPNSQLTIAALDRSTNSKTGKKADLVKMLSQMSRWTVLVGMITIVLLFLFAGSGTEASSATLNSFANVKGLWMLIPITTVVFVCLKSRNIFTSLAVAIVVGLIVGLATGLFTFSTIYSINSATGTVSGILADGLTSLISISMSIIFLSGAMAVLNKGGVLDIMSEWVLKHDFVKTPRGAEVTTALGMGVVNLLQSGSLMPSIFMYGDLADRIGHAAKISPERRAYLMVCVSMSVTGLIPLNSTFIMGLITTLRTLKSQYSFITVPGATSIFFVVFYSWVMTAVWIGWVVFGWSRELEPGATETKITATPRATTKPALEKVEN